MIKIEELKNFLYLGDLGDQLTQYNEGYICDVITEIADNNIDIYNYDLLQWVANNLYNIDYCDRAINEVGADNLISMIQGGQYLAYSEELYNNLEDIVKNYVLNHIEELEIEEITTEQWEEIESEIDFNDNNARLEDIQEQINDILNINE